MIMPIELCIECKDNPDDSRFYKCTAQRGPEAGLSIQNDGTVGWCADSGVGVNIWVGDDGRLLVYRAKGTLEAFVSRKGRRILLPEEKVALIRNRDELIVSGLSFVVHVHGQTQTVLPPRPIRVVRAAALAAGLSIAAAGCVESTSEKNISNNSAVHNRNDSETSFDTNSETKNIDTDDTDSNFYTDTGFDVNTDSDVIVLYDDAGDDTEIDIRDTPPIVIKK